MTNTCPFDVDIARDARPADQLHHIGAVYAYRFYRPDPEGPATTWRTRLADAIAAAEQADLLLRDAVTESRNDGATWEQVGSALGITRQAAWQRFGTTGTKDGKR